MRHRSNIAFILLAAALFAAPQVAHDLSTLKGAVAARIRGEILQAFLGLHANEPAAASTQAPRAELASASAPSADKADARPAPQAAQRKGGERASCPSQRGEAAAQSSARAQSAMLTDPGEKANAGLPPSAVAAELARLPRQVLDGTQFAMLTPPGNGVEPPPPAGASYEAGDARAKAARAKFAELEKNAFFFQARFERGPQGAEWFRRINAEAARAAGTEGRGKAKVIKLRRQGRACGDNAAPCAPMPVVPVAMLTGPDAQTQISDGE
jgi:hypothetical protein